MSLRPIESTVGGLFVDDPFSLVEVRQVVQEGQDKRESKPSPTVCPTSRLIRLHEIHGYFTFEDDQQNVSMKIFGEEILL